VCLVILALNQSRQYPLVLIANRDELHQRPTAAADFWSEQPRVIGGRDLLRGGTWLAVDHSGRLGAVTNFRDPSQDEQPRSRGDLVTDFIKSRNTGEDHSQIVERRSQDYAGFNLVIGQINRPFHYRSNRDQSQVLAAGVYGISNGVLDNDWPKVTRSKVRLQHWLQGDNHADPEQLFEILADRQVTTDEEADEWTQALTATFIVNPSYGTRASTCILFGADGQVVFEERRFDSAGVGTGSSRFEFSLRL
jgi:uncharacterized protein with NRDE domain